MTEQTSEQKPIEAFREQFAAEFDLLVDLIQLDDYPTGDPVDIDPFSMGFDERTIEELDPEEIDAIRGVLFKRLIPGDKKREYTDQNPETGGKIDVSVFETDEEEIELHEMSFSDGEKRWQIIKTQ